MDYLDADSNPHEHLIKYIKKPLVVLRLCAVVGVDILTIQPHSILPQGFLDHRLRLSDKPGMAVGQGQQGGGLHHYHHYHYHDK